MNTLNQLWEGFVVFAKSPWMALAVLGLGYLIFTVVMKRRLAKTTQLVAERFSKADSERLKQDIQWTVVDYHPFGTILKLLTQDEQIIYQDLIAYDRHTRGMGRVWIERGNRRLTIFVQMGTDETHTMLILERA